MFQSIDRILTLNFHNYFTSYAFYPFKYSLLFSDILLPQAILSLPFFAISKNLVFSFNIVFLITFVLNFTGGYLLFSLIFKNKFSGFIGSIFFIFSPYFHLYLDHFQMLSYWPFLFSFYYVLKNDKKSNIFYPLAAGIFLLIQFLASVYLSIYLLFLLIIFYFFKLFDHDIFYSLKNLALIIGIFSILGFVFINGYSQMKKTYGVQRNIEEQIYFSAHLADYIFTTNINSIIHSSKLLDIWNQIDKNKSAGHASFPGFLLAILAIPALVNIKKDKEKILIQINLNREKGFFLIILLVGFIFSLGPRLSFNGNYDHIPLPYSFVLKYVPLVESTRVPARWVFLFYLGIIYFSLITFSNLKKRKYYHFWVAVIIITFILEYIPMNISTHSESYVNHNYETIRNLCRQKKLVLMEIPVMHLDFFPNILDGLNYITQVELSSTYNGCYLKNGYSGYDLPELQDLKFKINQAIKNYDTDQFISILQKENVDIVKLNNDKFAKELEEPGYQLIQHISTYSGIVKEDDYVYLLEKNKTN